MGSYEVAGSKNSTVKGRDERLFPVHVARGISVSTMSVFGRFSTAGQILESSYFVECYKTKTKTIQFARLIRAKLALVILESLNQDAGWGRLQGNKCC